MIRHTPGPWRRYQKSEVVAVVIDDGTDREIVHWSGFDSSDFPHDSSANARLIAAAPDLLALLRAVARSDRTRHCWCPIGKNIDRHGHSDLCARVKAVIARVEGTDTGDRELSL